MSENYLAVQHVFDALIAGIGVMRRGLDAKCREALYAFGSRAAPYLYSCAASQSSSGRGKSLRALAAKIGDSRDLDSNWPYLCQEALLLAATEQTAEENPALMLALKHLGPEMVEKLINVAIVNRKKPAICLKVLEMIERIGGVSAGFAHMHVLILVRSTSEAVREQAIKLFCRSRRANPYPGHDRTVGCDQVVNACE
jgi:hypothetical protein